MQTPRIALLTIGEELLAGRITNTNAAWIGQQLHSHGLSLDTVTTCHDQPEEILFQLRSLLERHDVILTSGGLGPTTDDRTKETFLELCGGGLVLHEPTLAHIGQLFAKRKRPLNEHNRRQAMVPERCEVLHNRLGTAPGMRFQIGERFIIAMPGVPFELKDMCASHVWPWLQSHWPGCVVATRTIRTFNLPESRIAEQMEALTRSWPDSVEVAYLPAFDGVRIILQCKAPSHRASEAETLADQCASACAGLFRPHMYADSDATLPQRIKTVMQTQHLTLAVAESCTAGLIQAKLSQVSGVSAVLAGGVVVYSPQAKEILTGLQPDLVQGAAIYSDSTATAMAEGVRARLGTDVGLAITGLMEPSQEFPELGMMASVGVSMQGRTRTWRYDFVHDRTSNQERAAYAALFSLYQMLTEEGLVG